MASVDVARGIDRIWPCTNGYVPALSTIAKIFAFGSGTLLDGRGLLGLQGFDPARISLAYPGASYAKANKLAGNATCVATLGAIVTALLACVLPDKNGHHIIQPPGLCMRASFVQAHFGKRKSAKDLRDRKAEHDDDL